jgi:hypothetical protein
LYPVLVDCSEFVGFPSIFTDRLPNHQPTGQIDPLLSGTLLFY